MKSIQLTESGMNYLRDQLVLYSNHPITKSSIYCYADDIELGWREGQIPQCEIGVWLSKSGNPIIIELNDSSFYDVIVIEDEEV